MKRIYLSVMAAFLTVLTYAQDSGGGSGSSSTTVNVTKSSSTTFPWIWVVAGVVFLIILIALLSGGRRGSDTVVERKTIIKE